MSLQRLTKIGFVQSGSWTLANDELTANYTTAEIATQSNIIYAFTQNDNVKYIGKTTKPLRTRMQGYEYGHGQNTNNRIHHQIRMQINAGRLIQIYTFHSPYPLQIGEFSINIAGGLEDSLIQILQPSWNGGGDDDVEQEAVLNLQPEAVQPVDQDAFIQNLPPISRSQGTFNISVANQHRFANLQNDSMIELRAMDANNNLSVMTGRINRTYNQNGSPRIMVGASLRNWIAMNIEEGAPCTISVDGNQLTLRPTVING